MASVSRCSDRKTYGSISPAEGSKCLNGSLGSPKSSLSSFCVSYLKVLRMGLPETRAVCLKPHLTKKFILNTCSSERNLTINIHKANLLVKGQITTIKFCSIVLFMVLSVIKILTFVSQIDFLAIILYSDPPRSITMPYFLCSSHFYGYLLRKQETTFKAESQFGIKEATFHLKSQWKSCSTTCPYLAKIP